MNEIVSELFQLLGKPVVFINWPKGVKGTKRKWKNLTVADMTPEYLARLPRGNIGVALGEVSGGLCAIDVDNDALVEPFLAANPLLTETLQTHGSRGRVFWIRCDGDYPKRIIKLKTNSRDDVGEFRSNGGQSIIWGIHPDTKKAYEFIVKKPVMTVDFNSIRWPTEISNPPKLETGLLASDTERQSNGVTERQSYRETDVTDAIACAHFSPPLCRTIQDAVQLALPNKTHQNNDRLFTLARAVKSLEIQSGNFTPAQLREVFNQWFKLAAEFLRPEQTREDYMIQFLNAYASAKVPLGEGVIAQAWKSAQENPLPPEAVGNFEDGEKRLVVALCRELQIIAGQEPFYLSARTVQQLLKQDGHATAARWLRSLCVLQILTEIEKGSGIKASRYRFNFASV